MSLGKLSKLMDSLSESSVSLDKCVEVKKKKYLHTYWVFYVTVYAVSKQDQCSCCLHITADFAGLTFSTAKQEADCLFVET